MENYKIIEIIKEIKRGDMSNFQAIYDVFSRLINYYGKKIGEDGCGDITLFFMELLYSVDTDKFYRDEQIYCGVAAQLLHSTFKEGGHSDEMQ